MFHQINRWRRLDTHSSDTLSPLLGTFDSWIEIDVLGQSVYELDRELAIELPQLSMSLEVCGRQWLLGSQIWWRLGLPALTLVNPIGFNWKINPYRHLDQFHQRIFPLQLSPDEHCQLEHSTCYRSIIAISHNEFQIQHLPDCMKLILQPPCIRSFRYEGLDGFHFVRSTSFDATWIVKHKSRIATEN